MLQYGNKPAQSRSIRFANNQMDKVNLPIPNHDGPPSYDHSFILFERIGDQNFKIMLAKGRDRQSWLRKSKEQGLNYQFTGGRKYGFFS